jgi:hypothetical protein
MSIIFRSRAPLDTSPLFYSPSSRFRFQSPTFGCLGRLRWDPGFGWGERLSHEALDDLDSLLAILVLASFRVRIHDEKTLCIHAVIKDCANTLFLVVRKNR